MLLCCHWSSSPSTFRFLDGITNFGRSKCAIELDEFEYPDFWESENVNITISSKKISVIPFENHLQRPVICFEIEPFSIFFMSKDYVSLQEPCHTFVDRSARLGQLITRSLANNCQSNFMYRTWHTVLLLVLFISFWILVIQLNYGHSKCDESE
jgi:hypothetical protein